MHSPKEAKNCLNCVLQSSRPLTFTAEATSSGSCTSRPSLQVYRQSITFLFSSLPERIMSPARLPRKYWVMRALPPTQTRRGTVPIRYQTYALLNLSMLGVYRPRDWCSCMLYVLFRCHPVSHRMMDDLIQACGLMQLLVGEKKKKRQMNGNEHKEAHKKWGNMIE